MRRTMILMTGAAALAAVAAIGSAVPAVSEPTTNCSAMVHPPQTDDGSGNPLTRPGQLGELNQQPGPDGQMQMDCPPIGHG